MFLWVLILGFWFWIETHFDKNHDIWVIIEANGYLIFDLCLIANKTLSFIAWNQVQFDVYVIRLEFECSSLLLIVLSVFCFLHFFWCLIFFLRIVFVFFLVLILFHFKFVSWFSFELNLVFFVQFIIELVFFESTRSCQNWVKYLRL
jgi:hypothetical protein